MRLTKLQPAGPDELRRAILDDVELLGPGLRLIASGIPTGDRGTIDLLAADQRGRLVLATFRLEAGHEAVGAAIEAWDWTLDNLGLLRALLPGTGADLSLEPRLLLAACRVTEVARRLAGYIPRPEIDLLQVTLVASGEERGALVERAAPLPRPAARRAAGVDPHLAGLPAGEARSFVRRILEELRDARVEGEAFHPIGVEGDVDLLVGGRVVGSLLASGGGVQVRRYGGVEQIRVTTDEECREAVQFLMQIAGEIPAPPQGAGIRTAAGGPDGPGAAGVSSMAAADALTPEEIAEFERVARAGSGVSRESRSRGAARPAMSEQAPVAQAPWTSFVEN